MHRTEKDYALAEFWKWAISCFIGLAMGCIGFSVDWGINLLNDAKYQSTANVLRTHGKHSWFVDHSDAYKQQQTLAVLWAQRRAGCYRYKGIKSTARHVSVADMYACKAFEAETET